jgi:hypothetical protein
VEEYMLPTIMGSKGIYVYLYVYISIYMNIQTDEYVCIDTYVYIHVQVAYVWA